MKEAPLHEQVMLHLQKALMQGRFKPGQKLALRSLAEELGTSVAPVREAVSRLAALDALRVYPKRFILVPTLTAEKYFEFVEVRKLLEGHAAARACQYMTDEDVRELIQHNKNIRKYFKEGRLGQAMTANQKFHFKIYECANSSILIENIKHIWLRIGPTLHQVLSGYVTKNIESHPLMTIKHRPLIDALSERDSLAALNAIIEVIDLTADIVLAGLRRQYDVSSDTLRAVAALD